MYKFILIPLFVIFFSVSAFAIEGEYVIAEGKSQTGDSYTGNVSIGKRDDIYLLSWQIAKTGEQYRGIGILKNNVLSVAWGIGSTYGVVSYKVEGDKLVGTWAAPPSTSVGTETLRKK